MKNRGIPQDLLDGGSIIGICNTHFGDIAERVKRGVDEAGGYPVEFRVMPLGESKLRPTAILFRNLASMDVEESIRGNPIAEVVLLCGCQKVVPALLMGLQAANYQPSSCPVADAERQI